MKTILIMLLAGLPVLVGAQEKKRTLEECMRYAVENSTRTAKLKAQNEIYAADRQEAIAGFFPSLNMETGLSMSFGRSLDPETNGYINTTTWRNNYEVYSSMPLFNGFSRVFKAKSAKINRLKGLDELQDANDMIAYETMELFFNVQYYMGTVRLAEEQLDESVDNLKRFERMEELGLKSAPDVAEIRAKEAEDRYSLTRQKNLYKLELIKLKEKMNFPIDAELEITNVDAGLLIDTSKENVLDVYRKMLQISPQVAAAGKALEISRLNLKMAKGNALPRILLNGSYSTGFSRLMDGSEYMHFKDQLKNRQGTAVGISLSIPILNGLTRASEIKRSKSRLEIAENEHQELLRRVYSEIEQTVADVNGLSDEYLHAKQRTDAMKAAHQVNTRKYEEGLIDAMELSTSANRLLQSQIEELYINLKYQLKHRLLEYYKGNAPLYLP